jgi:hypothetical protein
MSDRYRLFLLVSLAALGGGLIGAALAIDKGTYIEAAHSNPPPGVIVGLPFEVEITVRNNHLWRAVTVTEVQSSCGCLDVAGFDATVAPRGTGRIRLRGTLSPRIASLQQSVRFRANGRESRIVPVTLAAVPPFKGYPSAAVGKMMNGCVTVPIAAMYQQVISDARVMQIGTDSSFPVHIRDGALTICSVPPEEGAARLLVITFGEGSDHNWSGPLLIPADRQHLSSED